VKDELLKSYDIMMEQQNKADGKTQAFIAMLTGVVSFFWGVQQLSVDVGINEGYQVAVYLLLLPSFFFVISLVPVYQDRFVNMFKKKKNTADIILNIFYWTSISEFKNDDDFISCYQNLYHHEELSHYEMSILKQIKVNANILYRKVTYHRIAFMVLMQDFLFAVSIVLYDLVNGVTLFQYILICIIIEGLFIAGLILNRRIKKNHH